MYSRTAASGKKRHEFNISARFFSLEILQHEQLLDHFSLTGFANLAGQEHLVHNCVDFVKVEHQVQLADVVEVLVEHFDKVVDGLQIGQVVVADVDANAKVEAGVASVHDLEVTELDKVGVLGVAHRHHGVDLLDQLLLLIVIELHVPFC